ncbi:MAG: endolytic transglycosylase MltG, partial [Segetibacter sp.]
LKNGMKLESDPTFKFAARQLGVEPSIHLESPYNTRLHKGLPPGPISNTSYSALTAVARPAKGDDLYFVAGDDGTVYFSKTFQEHQAKVKKYCHKLCE